MEIRAFLFMVSILILTGKKESFNEKNEYLPLSLHNFDCCN